MKKFPIKGLTCHVLHRIQKKDDFPQVKTTLIEKEMDLSVDRHQKQRQPRAPKELETDFGAELNFQERNLFLTKFEG